MQMMPFNIKWLLSFLFFITEVILSLSNATKTIITLQKWIKDETVEAHLSLFSQQNNIMSRVSPQKASRSLPPLPKQHSYIEKTLDLLEGGCVKEGPLNIDGDIGDYRMRLFRNKDRKDYVRNIHSVFTNSFTDSILPKEPHNKDVRQLITEIVKQPYRHAITPPPEAKMTIESQQAKGPRLGKGDLNGVMEQEGTLIYKYLPQYQRRRWFQVKDMSPLRPQVEEKAGSVLSNKKSYSLSKKSNKIRHIFAYLENPIYLKTIK